MAVTRAVPLFHFRMGQGRGVGPRQLRSLWAVACGSEDVEVSRQSHIVAGVQLHVYALGAPASVGDIDAIERRLKRSLDALAGGVQISLTRLG